MDEKLRQSLDDDAITGACLVWGTIEEAFIIYVELGLMRFNRSLRG